MGLGALGLPTQWPHREDIFRIEVQEADSVMGSFLLPLVVAQ